MTRHYLEQRWYPTLQLGLPLTVSRGLYNTPVHIQQGVWDGACGPHCAAMALTIMGRISNVATLCDRTKGVAARLWKAAQAQYFDGVTAAELANMIASLETDLHVEHYSGSHRKCRAFVQTHLDNGRLVIVSWSTLTGGQHHWVLAIGMEGMRTDDVFIPQALLVLDSSASATALCANNGRLEFAGPSSPARSLNATYICSDGSIFPVTLTSAVAIGERA